MNFALTPEQQAIVDTVRSFVEKELYPHEAEVERTGAVPPELGASIRQRVLDLGFYAPNMPEEVGGGGLDQLTFTLLERELGRASMALSVFWGRPSNILLACEGEQRERYLLPAVRGEKQDALAMTEPQAGSDIRSMQCRARRAGGGWEINGAKHFISHGDVADFFIVFVATGEEEEEGPGKGAKKKKITCFLVDRDAPGFQVREGYESVSHRGYHNSILDFDNCRLGDEQILGELDGGFAVANTWLYATRLSVAALCVGRARRAFDLATEWAVTRRQFGRQISRFQGISFPIADMVTEIDAADWLTLAAAWRLDQGLEANREIASAKLYASEMLARGDRHRPADPRRHGPHERPAA